MKHRAAFAEGIPGCFVYWRNALVEFGQQPMTLKVMSVAGKKVLWKIWHCYTAITFLALKRKHSWNIQPNFNFSRGVDEGAEIPF